MDIIETLRGVSTATITSQLIKQGGMRTRAVRGVRPIDPARCRFVGPAATVRYAPMREDLDPIASIAHPDNPMTRAIETMAPGSVLVVDSGGGAQGGALGDVLVARLIARGIAAVVSDGAMRDIAAVASLGLPVFSAAHTPNPSAAQLLAVETGTPIGCGGVLVYPGDIVIGDGDGVAVIPQHLAAKVAEAGLDQERMEAWIRARIERGEPLSGLYPPSAATVAQWRAHQGDGDRSPN
jgi:regulator of RNase E activity RraA